MPEVVLPDAASVAQAVADVISRQVVTGQRTLGLAGGTTPRTAYELLPSLDLDWSGMTLWLSDERWVPPDDPDSNGLMVRNAFADAVGARLLVPDYAADDPAAAAAAYTKDLVAAFAPAEAPDLVLLGMGEDGHTASLFPGTEALAAKGERFVENWVPAMEAWRLTATLELLWAARELVFIVTGSAKADALANARRGDSPAHRAAAGANKVTWIVDEAAMGASQRGQ